MHYFYLLVYHIIDFCTEGSTLYDSTSQYLIFIDWIFFYRTGWFLQYLSDKLLINRGFSMISGLKYNYHYLFNVFTNKELFQENS